MQLMQLFLHWLNERTGYRRLLAPIHQRMLPNGPSWTLSTASCLFWLLVIEIMTGVLMMTTYSPSTSNAWASVHYIESAPGGSFIRGLHYYAAQAMIILLICHLVRVVLQGAYRAPRELIWASGLILLPVVIVWTVTGNPLSGTVEGFSQIEIEGHIAGSTPVVGPIVQQLLIGGDQVGNLTVTHLYFLHVGLLPFTALILLVLHIAQIYRHGLSTGDFPTHPERARHYFPHQSARNMVVFTILFAGLIYLAATKGAPFGAPADDGLPKSPRPEWYFLWLFKLRSFFNGPLEFIATMVIPGALLGYLLMLPLIDHLCSRRTSHFIRLGTIVLGMLFIGGLTGLSMYEDANNVGHQWTKAEAEKVGERARFLADHHDIPPEGAVVLLREDALTQGKILFTKHCLVCHSAADDKGNGLVAEKPTAPNLYGFGTRRWVAGFLDAKSIAGHDFFGNTKFVKGEMVEKINKLFEVNSGEKQSELKQKLASVTAMLSAEAGLQSQKKLDADEAPLIADGRKAIKGELLGCTDCHKFGKEGDTGPAPDLTGYGSREWLSAFISNPEQERFYPKDASDEKKGNDRMPGFLLKPDHPQENRLTAKELDFLVTWLRGEWEAAEPAKPGK